MIDLLTIQKLCLDLDEAEAIAEHNSLDVLTRVGTIHYDNAPTKNLTQHKGISIRIATNRKLTVEGSLHKFYNDSTKNSRTNFDLFTMRQAVEAAEALIREKRIPDDSRIYNVEVGINLNVSKPCRVYLDKMVVTDERKMYVNPRYKDERIKTTIFSRHQRKYFKAYDKVFEMADKKTPFIPTYPILRIETAYRRLENQTVKEFFSPKNLHKLVEVFFRDWRAIKFKSDILTPKGTGLRKRMLCRDILVKSESEVLNDARERHASGILSAKEFRNIREFIRDDWSSLKRSIKLVPSDEEKEFRALLSQQYDIMRCL